VSISQPKLNNDNKRDARYSKENFDYVLIELEDSGSIK
jgi:hypothetical protein